ncbi:hypothetical protein [Caldicellulosiruptor acetigenus]|uniref:hypothetical protein n=2 Tax=Caldicellulosiruptor acetigenus TaxID=301953 RepID=UPI00040826D0|nr:hypothetical protein [Caldicellulosiruptor acetigenus]
MKKRLLYANFVIAIIVQFLFYYLFTTFVPLEIRKYYLIFFILLVFLTFLYDSLKSFVFLVSGMLITAFYIVISSWIRIEYGINQFEIVFQQMLIIILSISIWLESLYLKNIVDNSEKLKEKVKQLEKLHPEAGVLTFNEFLERAEIIFTGLRRRSEEAQLLVIKVSYIDDNNRISKTFINTIGRVLIDSVRKNYDIICYIENTIFLVLLQNTNKQGAMLVVDRIRRNLRTIRYLNPEIIEKHIDIKIESFNNDFLAFKEYIQNLANNTNS